MFLNIPLIANATILGQPHPELTVGVSSECGAAFTSKLEGMFKDMELSKDIMVQFKQVRASTLGSIDKNMHFNFLPERDVFGHLVFTQTEEALREKCSSLVHLNVLTH